MESNYLVDMSFVGTAYHGSQIQNNAVTVQEVFQQGLKHILGTLPDIKCCSRTDAGVHAIHFCISFHSDCGMDCGKMVMALNAYLPDDIRVNSVKLVPEDFHARYSSLGKKYTYLVWNSRVMNPFYNERAFQFVPNIDAVKLNETAQAFLGSHDFSAFCSIKSDVQDKVRTVTEISVKRNDELVSFDISADGFLYNMARIIVGSLLQVARDRLNENDILSYLSGKPRDNKLITVPSYGLYLSEVKY